MTVPAWHNNFQSSERAEAFQRQETRRELWGWLKFVVILAIVVVLFFSWLGTRSSEPSSRDRGPSITCDPYCSEGGY